MLILDPHLPVALGGGQQVGNKSCIQWIPPYRLLCDELSSSILGTDLTGEDLRAGNSRNYETFGICRGYIDMNLEKFFATQIYSKGVELASENLAIF